MLKGMIAKFLNATTADGYNPYRITRDGIEWEVPEPDNPWSNIGYWSDHQIIYLQKLLEIAEQTSPGTGQPPATARSSPTPTCPTACKPLPDMLADWSNTIDL
jgi:methionyl-tRNA synthetase